MSIHVNKSKAKGFLRFRFLMGLLVLVACWGCMASATQAQGVTNGDGLPDVPRLMSDEIDLEDIKLEDLPSTDLSGLSSRSWKALRKEHTRLLSSSDEKIKERALQNIIFFAKTYPDHVDFTRSVSKLYKIYQRDDNEAHRIMALSALGVIGNRNVMALLREDVSVEESERVRTYTLYVLAEYYDNHGRF